MCDDLLSHILKGRPFVIEWKYNKKVFTEKISKNELYDVYFTVEFNAV